MEAFLHQQRYPPQVFQVVHDTIGEEEMNLKDRSILFWLIIGIGILLNVSLIGLVIYGLLNFPLFASGFIATFVIGFIIIWYLAMLKG